MILFPPILDVVSHICSDNDDVSDIYVSSKTTHLHLSQAIFICLAEPCVRLHAFSRLCESVLESLLWDISSL